MSTVPTPATPPALTAWPVVAGVDTGLGHERDADPVALGLGRALESVGIAAMVGTHVVPGTQTTPSYVALSVALLAMSDSEAHRVIIDALRLGALSLDEESKNRIGIVVGQHSSGPDERAAGAQTAREQRLQGRAGRAVWFPGVDELIGTLSAARVLELSPIEEIRLLGAGDVPGSTAVMTRDFVRPRWDRGRLVLHVQPAAGATLVPFEVPDPTPCCDEH